ncbi:60S acidic ribosomal protein P3 [Zea mays]|uniref:60S acidic ribosomal protein P3 n=2 Tax=Zea mays TaxID=4577 RepID=A0A1D6LNJ7_MAIZE|nr:60S acidic ribosomal protein P3-like [Zea mays]AQK81110.1 60S acidic ribosomal protein P3-2 [Zea mays]AQK81112.1 60S acidic ribosomal protein P3 [Zea mays]PWZ19652.1 60S acidic ribosomal protein P3 [Zea mays]|eukprot:NP_001316611.1 60S acidic ribosomal protein P3-like [Zea mays]
MGVYTFVCRSAGGGEWTAKQHSGEIEASAATPYELQRRLVASASAADSASGVQSSFSMVTPSSAVFQVIVGGGAMMVSGGGGGGASAAASGGAAAEAPKEEKKEEEKEESDDDMGFSLFD